MDEKSQVVLAVSLRQSGSDYPALLDMLTELAESLTAAGIEGSLRTLLADAGYLSAHNVEAVTDAGIDPLLATGRLKHAEAPPAALAAPRGRIPAGLTPKQLMSRKLRNEEGQGRLRPAQSDRGTGLRSDQRRSRRPSTTAPRPGQSRHRVDLPPGLPQLPQTRRVWMDNDPEGHHLKAREPPLRLSESRRRRSPSVISIPTNHNYAGHHSRTLERPRAPPGPPLPVNRFGLRVLGSPPSVSNRHTSESA